MSLRDRTYKLYSLSFSSLSFLNSSLINSSTFYLSIPTMSDKRTCLYDRHVALGAKMVSFGGFEMPLQYTDIAEEHQAVRTACGVFDVSHMGEIFVSGKDAERFVQLVFTNDISQAPTGKIFYGMMLHPTGGTVDDLLVYKQGENDFLLVVNAANIEKDYAWLLQAQQEHPNCR